MTITNNAFSSEEKKLLNFILKHDPENGAKIANYINGLSTEYIYRDDSPYHKIIEFRTPNIEDGYSGMSALFQIQTVKKDGSAPTVFTLYAKDGFPFEYEIYNADSTILNMNDIFSGDVFIGKMHRSASSQNGVPRPGKRKGDTQ